MHAKEQKFNDFLQVNGLKDVFAVQRLENELDTVLYLSYIDIHKEKMPLKLVLDISGLVFIQVLVAEKAVKKFNRVKVLEKVNEYNDTYKLFKYYVDEAGNVTLESCMPTTDELFQPDMVKQIIDIIINHLEETYYDLQKVL